MAEVRGVLDVMCAMGVVGVALVTGMADVAHAGNRDGLGRLGRAVGRTYPVERTVTAGRRLRRRRASSRRPDRGVCTQTAEAGHGV